MNGVVTDDDDEDSPLFSGIVLAVATDVEVDETPFDFDAADFVDVAFDDAVLAFAGDGDLFCIVAVEAVVDDADAFCRRRVGGATSAFRFRGFCCCCCCGCCLAASLPSLVFGPLPLQPLRCDDSCRGRGWFVIFSAWVCWWWWLVDANGDDGDEGETADCEAAVIDADDELFIMAKINEREEILDAESRLNDFLEICRVDDGWRSSVDEKDVVPVLYFLRPRSQSGNVGSVASLRTCATLMKVLLMWELVVIATTPLRILRCGTLDYSRWLILPNFHEFKPNEHLQKPWEERVTEKVYDNNSSMTSSSYLWRTNSELNPSWLVSERQIVQFFS